MTRPFRILGAAGTGSNSSSSSTPPTSDDHDSDFVIVLAALLCGLICVLGLLTVFRCACFNRPSSTSNSPPPLPKAANKGLKKKILRSLPKLTFSPESSSSSSAGKASDCAICLAEFVAGDEIRVLPQCRHSFHVACIDSWLKSHSTCPSCRRIIAAGDHEVKNSAKERGNHEVGNFLP